MVSATIGRKLWLFPHHRQGTLLVIAVAVWGKNGKATHILLHSDNTATVSILNSGTSHDSEAMHLMNRLTANPLLFQKP